MFKCNIDEVAFLHRQFCVFMKVRVCSVAAVVSGSLRPYKQPTRLLCPREFSRQEYWSGLPFLSPGHLSNPGIESRSLAQQADSLPSEPSAAAAAAAANSLQPCPTLCNPIDGSPPGSPVPGILQARTLEWVAISFFNA